MKRGSITIFASLSMMLVASLLLALLASARVYGFDSYAQMKTHQGVVSACAEYQPLIWENYHLLMLDGAYGTDNFSIDRVSEHVAEHIEKSMEWEESLLNFRRIDLFQLRLKNVEPLAYQLATDGEGEVFLNQVASVMKETLPMEIAEKLFESYQNGKEIEENHGDISSESVERAEQALQEAGEQKGNAAEGTGSTNSENVEPENAQTAVPVEENPLEIVRELKQNAVLGLVLEDVNTVSVQQADLSNRLEQRDCEAGNMELPEQTDWYRKILILTYLEEYFSCYTEPKEGHYLKYEMEYLLGGEASEKANLEKVIDRLLLMREAANVTYLLGDKEKMELAGTLAELIGGATGNPGVVMLVKVAIIGAWAFLESVLDVRTLLAGEKIALIKRQEQWTTDVSHLAESFGQNARAKECENGFTYCDYLKQQLFFLKENQLAYRMMDVIEQSLSQQEAYKNGRMDHMVVAMEYRCTYTAEPLFGRLSVLGNRPDGDLYFQAQQEFTYLP